MGAFEQHGRLSAGTVFFVSDGKIIFIFGSSNKRGRKNGALRNILDWMIRKNCGKHLVLDFQGSSIDSVEYFYKGFGSTEVNFLNIKHCAFGMLGLFIKAKQRVSKVLAQKRINKLLRSESLKEILRPPEYILKK